MAVVEEKMLAFDVLNKVIKKDLVDAFGFGLASLIMVDAKKNSNAPATNLTENDILNIIEAVSKDVRVLDMWGNMGVMDKIIRWKKALGAQ